MVTKKPTSQIFIAEDAANDIAVSRMIAPTFQNSDQVEKALRPQTLDEFTGQPKLRQQLGIYIKAAKQRNEPLDHVLLAGPPGLGKTTLAHIISRELGVGFRATSGPVLAKAGDLAAILTNLQPHDVLFIDEIHRLSATVEEILYPAMEDGKLDLIIGEGPAARSVQIDLNPFTLVAATTRSGLLTTPLRERFGIPLRLEFYSPEDLQKIVLRAANLLKMNLLPEGALEIAKRSRGTPRVANRLTRRVRDMVTVHGHTQAGQIEVDHALQQLEIDARGLDAMDRRYLKIMADHYAGGPVGVETLATTLGEERDVLEDVIEPYLIQEGLVQRTPRGRQLSSAGYAYLGLPTTTKQDLLSEL